MSYALQARPETFVSDGDIGSIVGDWVRKLDNVGGIHPLAYEVQDVEKTMSEWKQN